MALGEPLRVLYVEDDRISALLMRHLIATEPDVELRVAENGAEALAAVDGGWTPELLILDAHLPDTSGHALLARLRERPALRGVPACMCSADETASDRRRADAAGFDTYWAKPLPVPAVLGRLRALKAASR